MLSDDEKAEEYLQVVETLERFGFERYEVSSFARGEKFKSLHNQAYWDGSPYFGIGPGAHSRLLVNGTEWFERVEQPNPVLWAQGFPGRMKAIDEQQRTREIIGTSLRTRKGVSRKLMSNVDFSSIKMLENEGFIEDDGNVIRCTKKGLNVVDSVLQMILK